MENLLFALDVWLVLTALWLLITFRKFALADAGAWVLKVIIFAVFVFGILRLPETAGVLLADPMATTLLLTLRATLAGTIILVTLVKIVRRRTRRHAHRAPTIL